ncbi:MAG: ABC transporter permease [Chloroflexota bacterium]|nr:ABC transporter permease [Chloroflexota bacterium]
MNIREVFSTAVNSLLLNKLRSGLTMLGIVIGIAAVVSMVSIGRGIGDYINQQFSDLGATRLQVLSQPPRSGFTTRIVPLTSATAAALANPQNAPSVVLVAPEYSLSANIRAGGRGVGLSVTGVTPSYTEAYNWQVQPGNRFINSEDVENNARVAVLGTSTVKRLFGSESFNPVGLQIDIDDLSFTVIGVMSRRTSVLGFDPNNVVLVPISTAQTRLDNARERGGALRVSQITVLARDKDTVAAATREIRTYLRLAHGITDPVNDDFAINNEAQQLSSLNRISSLLTVFLGVIGAISLIVGGIGILNIMLVSVTERTREIGLRKALGATREAILSQFLIESILLCVIGGGVGILLSYAIIALGNTLAPTFGLTVQLSLAVDTMILATGVSSAIGILFGLYPSNRAARMRPIEALRFE